MNLDIPEYTHDVPNTPCAYALHHADTGTIYVGSTVQPKSRISNHLSKLRNRTHPCKRLQEAYNASPIVDIVYRSASDEAEAQFEEQKLVNTLHRDHPERLLNICIEDVRNLKGVEVSPETREKIGAFWRGKVIEREVVERRSRGLKGHVVSEETRDKIRKAQLGKIVPDEARQNMRNAQLGKTLPEEQKVKIRLNSPTRREITIDGVRYPSISAAGRALGIGVGTVYARAGITALA